MKKEQKRNMSGLGPAACWLAHKRIESWSRIAKERVGAVRKSTEKSDATTSTTSMSISTDSTNESIASSNEVSIVFHFLLIVFC